jgi:flagellin-like hook-associated protein FlgL
MIAIGTNASALMAQAATASVQIDAQTAMQRLSSGKRINAAKDDAAGVAIASRMTSHVRGLHQSIRNSMDAQALISTAEGGLQETEVLLQRIRELAVQASNDTNSNADRTNLNNEAQQLLAGIDAIASGTTWAGQNLLDGTYSNKSFQVGGGSMAADQLTTSLQSSTAIELGLGAIPGALSFSAKDFMENSFFEFPKSTKEISTDYLKLSWTEGRGEYRPNLLSFKPIKQTANLEGSLTLSYDLLRPNAADDHDPAFYISDGTNAVAWFVAEDTTQDGRIRIHPSTVDGNFFQQTDDNVQVAGFGWGAYSGKYRVQIDYALSGNEIVSTLSLTGENGESFITNLEKTLSDFQSLNLIDNENISFGIIGNQAYENYWIENLNITADGIEIHNLEVPAISLTNHSNAQNALIRLDTA